MGQSMGQNMGLTEYRGKRDFKVTSEPRGTKRSAPSARSHDLRFVIQEHHASHLHYDFRLELEGVLKSWAVPKGPPLKPGVKRLAVQVEDHPVSYGSFEGTIPEGEYGAGTVRIWDEGTWNSNSSSESSARNALKNGVLKFELHGRRLRGQWALVRMKRAKTDNAWLLIKEKDGEKST